jgi:hypothetical protein
MTGRYWEVGGRKRLPKGGFILPKDQSGQMIKIIVVIDQHHPSLLYMNLALIN